MNDIIEEALNSIECLVQRCPKEISPKIDEILSVSEDFMTYDPNYAYDFGDEAMEDDAFDNDEWASDEDEDIGADDDTSWKVRRGSIKVILAIIHSRPEMLRALY
jgi:cullin-associated NEDD8-dissociated protein 1